MPRRIGSYGRTVQSHSAAGGPARPVPAGPGPQRGRVTAGPAVTASLVLRVSQADGPSHAHRTTSSHDDRTARTDLNESRYGTTVRYISSSEFSGCLLLLVLLVLRPSPGGPLANLPHWQ
eukprot:322726-Hanusia_phi.AAC.1